MKKLSWMGLTVVGLGMTVATAHAQEPAQAPASTGPATEVSAQSAVVAIDPKTGLQRSVTAADRAQLSQQLQQQLKAQAAATGRPLTMADALKTVRVNPSKYVALSAQVPLSLTNELEATRNPDGSFEVHHKGDAPAPRAQEVAK